MFPESNVDLHGSSPYRTFSPIRTAHRQAAARIAGEVEARTSLAGASGSRTSLAGASGYGAARRGPRWPGICLTAVGWFLLLHVVLCGGGHAAAAEEQELFAGTFPNTSLAQPWKTIGGTWQVQQGVLQQVNAGLDDPSKAVLLLGDAEEMSSGIMVTARLRLDTWKGDDQARAGVGLCCDPETGYGLNLAFNRGQLQFVHDYVTWAPGCPFTCQTGTWYWMKLCRTAGELRGKAWLDGQPEPPDWMVSWTTFDQSLTGYPALLGCSGGPGAGGSTVSFAECRVVRIGPSPTAYYTKQATWQETLIASLDALARQGTAAASPPARPATRASRASGGGSDASSPIPPRGVRWLGNGKTTSGHRTGRASRRPDWPSATPAATRAGLSERRGRSPRTCSLRGTRTAPQPVLPLARDRTTARPLGRRASPIAAAGGGGSDADVRRPVCPRAGVPGASGGSGGRRGRGSRRRRSAG